MFSSAFSGALIIAQVRNPLFRTSLKHQTMILISEIKVERTLASIIRQHERTRTPAQWKSFPSEVYAINKIFIQRLSTFAQMTTAIAVGFHMGAVEASSN